MKHSKYNLISRWSLFLFCFLATYVNSYAGNTYSLSGKETIVLMKYFAGIKDGFSPEKFMENREVLYDVIWELEGDKGRIKDENELKLYVTLILMVYVEGHPGEEHIITKGLYPRFELQPGDYFEAVRHSHLKRDALCAYLGLSYSQYLKYNTSNKAKSARQVFAQLYRNSLKKLGHDRYIKSCLSKF